MSSGAMVPISTRARLSFSDWRARSSDCRCTLRLRDRTHQVVVGVAHVAHGVGDRLLQLRVGDLAVLLADQQLLAHAVDLEVAQQRLRVGRREVRR